MKIDQVIRLLVAGPRTSEARALDQLLTRQHAIVVVGETIDLSRLPDLARSQPHDVILLHARGPESALDEIRVILAQIPEARLLVVVSSFTLDEAALILEHGARGVVAIDDAFPQGLRAVRAVHGGEIWGSRAILSRIVQASIRHTMQVHALSSSSLNLTQREGEIVNLLRSGSSNKEIATELQISDKTVKTHLHNIFGKLQIRRRQQILPALLS